MDVKILRSRDSKRGLGRLFVGGNRWELKSRSGAGPMMRIETDALSSGMVIYSIYHIFVCELCSLPDIRRILPRRSKYTTGVVEDNVRLLLLSVMVL
jgi:hypothetical protein